MIENLSVSWNHRKPKKRKRIKESRRKWGYSKFWKMRILIYLRDLASYLTPNIDLDRRHWLWYNIEEYVIKIEVVRSWCSDVSLLLGWRVVYSRWWEWELRFGQEERRGLWLICLWSARTYSRNEVVWSPISRWRGQGQFMSDDIIYSYRVSSRGTVDELNTWPNPKSSISVGWFWL